MPHSPGLPNDGQVFALPEPARQGIAVDALRVTFVPDHDLDGLRDEVDADDDNDSMVDALERAFGSDPLDVGSRFAPRLEVSPAGTHDLVFAAASGITYTIEGSADLVRWQTHTTHAGTGATARIPLPRVGGQRFHRVRAALLP